MEKGEIYHHLQSTADMLKVVCIRDNLRPLLKILAHNVIRYIGLITIVFHFLVFLITMATNFLPGRVGVI